MTLRYRVGAAICLQEGVGAVAAYNSWDTVEWAQRWGAAALLASRYSPSPIRAEGGAWTS